MSLSLNQPGGNDGQAHESALCYQHFAELFTYPTTAQLQGKELAQRQADYLHNFDCAVNGKGCSLNASDHKCPDRNALFEELLRFYNYYGLSRNERGEQPDHLSMELQFMHFLSTYESECRADARQTEDLRRAQKEFIDRFLFPFCTGIKHKLTDEKTFYAQLCGQLHNFLLSESQRLVP